ncbi:ATP-binding protein [Streptomyces sp. NPDC032472]|uniref:ATP-binding protein n=1 Tax=Streptomyces sp. NPDC032472 TaxID=3155018 RepID=UPI0033D51365
MCPSAALNASVRTCRADFPPGVGAGCARRGIGFVRSVLAEWQPGAPPEATADALLVAAELLSNAVVHGGGPQRLDLDLREGCLRIRVTDGDPRPPVLRKHRPEAVHGHGLFVVDRLAVRWGSRPTGRGKTVWADLGPAAS